jgi:hypothetical protein
MTLREALQKLRDRLGNDPDCGCEDCDECRAIDAQIAELDAQ